MHRIISLISLAPSPVAVRLRLARSASDPFLLTAKRGLLSPKNLDSFSLFVNCDEQNDEERDVALDIESFTISHRTVDNPPSETRREFFFDENQKVSQLPMRVKTALQYPLSDVLTSFKKGNVHFSLRLRPERWQNNKIDSVEVEFQEQEQIGTPGRYALGVTKVAAFCGVVYLGWCAFILFAWMSAAR